LSVSLLSQLERGVTSPSINSLLSLAHVLHVSVFDLFTTSRPGEEVVRADRHRKVELRHGNLVYELLSPNSHGRFEVWLGRASEASPEDEGHDIASTHGAEEFLLVLDGQLQVTIGDTEHLLHAGDSVQFDSGRQHVLRAKTKTVTFLSVVAPPTL
jgi:mannose-6-phosphate isomerase-like protein (cupin superfamily)